MHSLESFLLALPFVSPTLARSLWSSSPASNFSDIIRTAYTIGNGKLAALPFGSPGHDKLSLNHDSLWSGGPFQNTSYVGGNPAEPLYDELTGIRDWIWKNGTGNITALMHSTDDNNYGSYAVLGNLTVDLAGVNTSSDYRRELDLATGVHTITFTSGKASYKISTYCSYPDDVCIYDISSGKSLPAVSVSFENVQSNTSLVSTSCGRDQARLTGMTQADIGMKYDSIARIAGTNVQSKCSGSTLTIPSQHQKCLTLVIAAGTNYEMTHGTAAYNYSFRGADPGPYVTNAVNKASRKTVDQLFSAHMKDYSTLASTFTLSLLDTQNSASIETSELISRYAANSTAGDPYLESLAFDYGRHLFISSSRTGSLPPNLQGKWAYSLTNAWSADYHANINLQMNHWLAEQTGLGGLQSPLWEYMAETWAPRGAETARLIYNASGWVVHDEVNIFGFSGMKTGEATWANYPAAAAWMMQHVWDHYDYSRDSAWLEKTGYPLLKGISSFWVSQLQEDQYFKDGTLVANPCNSPEHGPTTFGCAHWQQLIHQVFDATLQAASIVSESDRAFVSSVSSSLAKLDTGLHIGSWNQLQEWKLDLDVQNDTHRHLSHLVGWYPGYSLSSFASGYTNSTIQSAIATTLESRGSGIADANAGWEKVWRSACWARLNDTEQAYYELKLAIQENWAANALSMYSGTNEPFQIDANFGFGGAVLSMLVVDLPLAEGVRSPRTVVLGPAIPKAWAGGSVKGLRVRGGGSVDFGWSEDGVVERVVVRGVGKGVRFVDRNGKVVGIQ